MLITGAYLIIDPKNEGLCLATDCRFHINLLSNPIGSNGHILIHAPQFKQTMNYSISKQSDQQQ